MVGPFRVRDRTRVYKAMEMWCNALRTRYGTTLAEFNGLDCERMACYNACWYLRDKKRRT